MYIGFYRVADHGQHWLIIDLHVLVYINKLKYSYIQITLCKKFYVCRSGS